MNKKPLILAVGANPAWQKVLQFNHLQLDAVNRAEGMWAFASGKGVNFVRAARNWGAADGELLQFAGGDNGRLLLDDLEKEQLAVKSFATSIPTRCCITCLSDHDNSMTELIEPSQAPSEAVQQQALDYIAEQITAVDGMALCGQLPSGMPIDFYVKCAGLAAENQKLLLIDSWKNIVPVLQTSCNAVLKINADELRALTGINEISVALKMLFESYALQAVAITDGAKTAYFATRDNCWQYTVPKLAYVVNPVGSGDTASAVLLSELLAGNAPEKAFGCALAAASANCCSMKCGEFDRAKAMEFYQTIEIQPV